MSGRVRNARKRLDRLRARPVPRPPDPLRFAALPTAGATGGELVSLTDLRVGGRLAVDRLSVAAADRLLIHGGNGAGKSTLLRVMAGVLEPDTGRVVRRGAIGYLAQEIPVHRPVESVLTAFGRGLPLTDDEQAELLLSYGLFRSRDLRVPVGSLSAGQRRRLALARLLARPADLLLLDEPHEPPGTGARAGAGGSTGPLAGRAGRGLARPVAAPPLHGRHPADGVRTSARMSA